MSPAMFAGLQLLVSYLAKDMADRGSPTSKGEPGIIQ